MEFFKLYSYVKRLRILIRSLNLSKSMNAVVAEILATKK